MLNFTWWVNRKDADGRNIFQGGFLGLDNIGIFDRSKPLPTGGYINQSDGTAWMAMYALNLMRIALELALEDHVYEDIASKFFEHFLYIAEAMTDMGGDGHRPVGRAGPVLLRRAHLPDGERVPLRVRSLVGLIPLFAVEVLDSRSRGPAARIRDRAAQWFLETGRTSPTWCRAGTSRAAAETLSALAAARPSHEGLLARMLDETEFLSDHGVRSLSKFHEAHPFMLEHGGDDASGSAMCRANRTPTCSAATPIGAGRSGCRSTIMLIEVSTSSTATTATISRWSARSAPARC